MRQDRAYRKRSGWFCRLRLLVAVSLISSGDLYRLAIFIFFILILDSSNIYISYHVDHHRELLQEELTRGFSFVFLQVLAMGQSSIGAPFTNHSREIDNLPTCFLLTISPDHKRYRIIYFFTVQFTGHFYPMTYQREEGHWIGEGFYSPSRDSLCSFDAFMDRGGLTLSGLEDPECLLLTSQISRVTRPCYVVSMGTPHLYTWFLFMVVLSR